MPGRVASRDFLYAFAEHWLAQVTAGQELHDEVVKPAVLSARVEDSHHGLVLQVHHRPRTAEESFAAQRIAGEICVQHLDRHALPLRAVVCLSDDREAAPTHDLHEQVAAIAQGIPGTELPPFAQLSAQLEDLSVDMVRRESRGA
jgi:hypothetical protein